MGYVALAASRLDEARRMFERALHTYEEVGSVRGSGQALLGLAATEAAAGRTDKAVSIGIAAEAMCRKAGIVVEHPMAPGVAERTEAMRASIPKQQLDDLMAAGSVLTPSAVSALIAV